MKQRAWLFWAACGVVLVPVVGRGQAPRYQSPYTTGSPANAPTVPALPTPPAITANGEVVEDVVARVNDQIISRSDVERSQQQLLQEEQQQNASPAEREQRQKDMLRDMIDQQLLLSKAKESGLNADAEVTRRLDEIRKQNNLPDMDALEKAARQQGVNYEDFKANIRNQILTQMVVRDEVGRHLQMTHGQEQAYYNAHKADFTQPEQVRLSEILIVTPADATDAQVAQAKQKAEMVEGELKAGKSFEELAKQYSGGQTASTGGDLGQYLRRDVDERRSLAKVLEDATFSLPAGQATAPIRTKQGFVILKVTEHQKAGTPPLDQIEPQVQEAMYMNAMQPALRAYLTKLREEAYIDVKPGFVDSGASPRETKPVFTAYQAPQTKKQKKVEQRVRLERSKGEAVVGTTKGALPPGSGAQALPANVSGATPVPGTTAALAKQAAQPAAGQTGTTGGTTVASAQGPTETAATGKVRRTNQKLGKKQKIKREKIRFGQAPRTALPAGDTQIAQGTDVGAGAQSAAVTPGGIQSADVAPGAAMAEGGTTVYQSGDSDPLAPKTVSTGKTRFSHRVEDTRDAKLEQKQQKVLAKAAATPPGPGLEEAATDRQQAAPLGLNGDTAKKQKEKKKRVKGEEKERLQDKKQAAPDATPISPTVNPNLGASGGAASDSGAQQSTPANPAPASNEKNTTLPSSKSAPGAPEQGQPLPPSGDAPGDNSGTSAPAPQQ